jgi:quinol monooxygenase YgiN
MIIVSGWIRVAAEGRAGYLDGCVDVIRAARSAPGCIDFHLSADPIEPQRINLFEQWESAEAVEAFRRSGPSDERQRAIVDASVQQHEVARTISLT